MMVRIAVVQDPRILYILGASRSGSTILNSILGAHPQILAMGELSRLMTDVHGGPRVCACGKGIEACPIWGGALRLWHEMQPDATAESYTALQRRFESFRNFPMLVSGEAANLGGYRTYLAWTRSLVDAVARSSGATILADSSKHPLRARALLRMGDVEVLFVHLVRDPRAVVWSRVKWSQKRALARRLRPGSLATVLRASSEWILVNRMAEMLLRDPAEKGIRTTYESFATDPGPLLREIGALAKIDLEEIAVQAGQGEAFGFGHIMSGNWMRLGTPSRVRLDTEWQTAAPRWMRSLVWSLTGLLARRYGYL